MITEGTYPYVHGGVSMWCDRLVRKLPDIEFKLLAISPGIGREPIWDLPPNVISLDPIELVSTTDRPFGYYPLSAQRRFLEAFDAFVNATLQGPTPDESRFLTALRMLFEASRDLPIDVGIRSAEAFEMLRVRWKARQVGDRVDRLGPPSLHDVLEVTSGWARFLVALRDPPDGDVSHTTANGLSSLPAFVAKWTRGTPCLLTEHGVYLRERYLEAHESSLSSRVKALDLLFFRRLNNATLEMSDLISPVSDYNRRWELETGADSAQIQTIYNGVEPSSFPLIDTEPAVPTVSWLGRIDPLKDVVTLIRAFAKVRDVMPSARLRLFGPVPVGNEEYFAECQRAVAESHLGDVVVFEGLISPPAGAFVAGHVVALSSISEGFPFTVLEAMMSGRATVSTEVGGVAEAVGEAGLLVAPRDPEAMAEALLRLLADDELRRRLGAAARKRALSLFTLDEMTSRYRDVYDELSAMPRWVNKYKQKALSAVGGN